MRLSRGWLFKPTNHSATCKCSPRSHTKCCFMQSIASASPPPIGRPPPGTAQLARPFEYECAGPGSRLPAPHPPPGPAPAAAAEPSRAGPGRAGLGRASPGARRRRAGHRRVFRSGWGREGGGAGVGGRPGAGQCRRFVPGCWRGFPPPPPPPPPFAKGAPSLAARNSRGKVS
ncbi:unnamed protein product, partial [Bubo scandiacus]